MRISLYDHQKSALPNIKTGSILCGDVGSGKSRTALAYYFTKNGGQLEPYKPMKKPKDLYIITTARKRDTFEWDEELTVFMLSRLTECKTAPKIIEIDSWNNIEKYVNVRDSFFIFDEQRVCGDGAWVKSFLKITKKNDWILLSATPGDKWEDYIPAFIANGFYKNRTEFKEKHMVVSHYGGYPHVDRYINVGRLIRLRDSILIDMNFERETIAHHKTVGVCYDVQLYRFIMHERFDPWKNEPYQNGASYCYGLRKCVNSDPSRLNAIRTIFEQSSPQRLIIFYNYDYELDMLRSLELGEDVEIAEWNSHKHQEIPSCKRWLYLVQYNAGAEGWNCIKTNSIVFFSQNYSYKMMKQACGRIDRLNTPFKELYYYHLMSAAPIDKAIRTSLKGKKKFNEMAFLRKNEISFGAPS